MKLSKKRLMQIINEELDDARGAEMDDLAMQSGDGEEPDDQDVTAALGALQRLMMKMPERGREIEAIIVSVRKLGGLAP